jgi:deoxyribodipyrimidine photo-lyase
MQTENILVWFRNDLRTIDNLVLYNACLNAKRVIAIYCYDPRQFEKNTFGFKKTEKFRAKFLIETINELKENLFDLNISLLVKYQKPEAIIPDVCETYQINQIYYQKEWTDEEETIENNLKSKISTITFKSFYNQFLYSPDDINLDPKDTPKVFTAFRKYIENQEKVLPCSLPPKNLPRENILNESETTFDLKDFGFKKFTTHLHTAYPFLGGENQGLERLNYYLFQSQHVSNYKLTRNGLIGLDYSTKFSPWLANGSLSAKYIYWQIKAYEKTNGANESTYWVIFELLWRDYFKYISLKHQNDLFKQSGITHRHYDWSTNLRKIQQWINGQTNEPFVNANMIELQQTGWMSNRGRQNVASFFSKNLKLDWRIGAAYFESMLIDYDVHSNYGNWQYLAGVGNDPRDRQFNISLQAKNYDPNYTYQNLWLTDL